jgi:hypothetical protein
MTFHAPISALPSPAAQPRIGMSEVCAIAMVGRLTIQRRIRAHKFPEAVDRGRESIFDRKAVYGALGIVLEGGEHASPETLDPWLAGADALIAR